MAFVFDEATQRYYKSVPGHQARDMGIPATKSGPPVGASGAKRRKWSTPPLPPPPPPPPPPLSLRASLPALLRLRETGALRLDASLWAERRLSRGAARVAGWCARFDNAESSADGALLQLRLADGADCLLAGGLGTGALTASDVVTLQPWAEEEEEERGVFGQAASRSSPDSESEEEQRPPPTLIRGDCQSRRSQVRAAVSLTPGSDAAGPLAPDAALPASALVAAAWLGDRDGGGVLSLLRARHKPRSGRLQLKEKANSVLRRTSLWCCAAAGGGGSVVLGTSEGCASWDVQTGLLSPLLRFPGSDVLSVAAPQHEPWALAGLRNGRVLWADARSPAPAAAPAFALPSALTSLSLHPADPERYAIAAAVDGTLARFDVRFGRAPVQTFSGHVSKGTLLLRHACSRSLLAAPGEDGAVRLWSLRTEGGRAPLAELGARALRGAGVTFSALGFGRRAEGETLWAGAHEGVMLLDLEGGAGGGDGEEGSPPAMPMWRRA